MLSEKTFNFLNNLSVLICFLLFTCQRPFKVFCWIPTKKYFTRNILSSIFTFIALVGSSGFEPPTLRLSGARSNHLSYEPVSLYVGGDEGIRTLDPLLAGQVLSQLSYTPSRVFPQTVSEDKTTTSKSFGHLSVSLIRIGSCSSNITDSP